MKFIVKTDEQREKEKDAKLKSWHKVFAFKPVRLTDENEAVVWLQFIYRKGKKFRDHDGDVTWKWEYVENAFDILKRKHEA